MTCHLITGLAIIALSLTLLLVTIYAGLERRWRKMWEEEVQD